MKLFQPKNVISILVFIVFCGSLIAYYNSPMRVEGSPEFVSEVEKCYKKYDSLKNERIPVNELTIDMIKGEMTWYDLVHYKKIKKIVGFYDGDPRRAGYFSPETPGTIYVREQYIYDRDGQVYSSNDYFYAETSFGGAENVIVHEAIHLYLNDMRNIGLLVVGKSREEACVRELCRYYMNNYLDK